MDGRRHVHVSWPGSIAENESDDSDSRMYRKNLRLQMGRCPVRSVFQEALELLELKQHLVGFVKTPPPRCWLHGSNADTSCRFMFDQVMPLSEAAEGYTLFEQRKTQKVVFKL